MVASHQRVDITIIAPMIEKEMEDTGESEVWICRTLAVLARGNK